MVSVAFQGEHGAYSELAIAALWPAATCVPYRENADVVRAVAEGEVDAGLLPIENSIAGTVTATLDALLQSDGVCITAETVIPISHCLLGVPGAAIADIRRVESHPVALAQCRAFFERHPALEPRPAYDTAGAARDIALANDRSRAAIASRTAAERYGLLVLLDELETDQENRTRFIALSRSPRTLEGASPSRTSLAVTIDALPGALHRLLAPIAGAGLDAMKLDASPLGEPSTHSFVLEVVHRGDDVRLGDMVAALERESRSCRILGTFPVAAEGW